MTVFCPHGNTIQAVVNNTGVVVELPPLPSSGTKVIRMARVIGQYPTKIWVKLGDSTVTGTQADSMQTPLPTYDRALDLAITDGQTHIFILGDTAGSGTFQITAGAML